MLHASFKSKDTEEWLDVHFTRPIGLLFALMWKRLGVHPNAITILSIFLGVGAAFMFYYTDPIHNLAGVALLMAANFCDSTDGQLARLTGQKTLIGRMLDGFSGDVWFFAIYVAIALRLMSQTIPGLYSIWGMWIWALAIIAGVLCHSPQSSLADYYRQIHLFFLKGKEGSELDSAAQQRQIYESLPKGKAWLQRAFYYNYANYCKSQEQRTPAFQRMAAAIKTRYGGLAALPAPLKQRFLDGSRPLMKYTNMLSFNTRVIALFVSLFIDMPWLYFVFEMTVLNSMLLYMIRTHERICKEMIDSL